MSEKTRCFALRLPKGENQSPAVCQETGLSGSDMRKRCPIQNSTTSDCHFNGKPIPQGFLLRWKEILSTRAKQEKDLLE